MRQILTLSVLALLAVGPADAVLEQSWSNPSPTGAEIAALAHDPDTGRTVAVGRVGAVVTSDDAGQTWTDRTDLGQLAADLHDVLVTAPDACVAVGGGGAAYRSFDGGVTWEAVPVPGATILRNVERVGSTLIAVGDGGVVARSADGGATWLVLGDVPFDIQGQGWADASTGVVVGSFDAYITTDGGFIWTEIPEAASTGFMTDADWFSASHGFIMYDFGYFETTDGGDTWVEQSSLGSDEPLYLGQMVELAPDHWVLASDGEGAEMWVTEDAGDTWTVTDERFWARGYVDLVRHPDGTLLSASELGDLIRSVDDGQSWTNTTLSPGVDDRRVVLGQLAARPDGVLFAGGRDSGSHVQFMRSDDAGASWTEVSHPGTWFHTMGFNTSELGITGGDQNVIHRTTDGGDSWTTIPLTHPLGTGYRAADLAMPDDTHFFVSGFGAGQGGVFRSDDAGESWEFASTGIPASTGLGAIFFVDALTGYTGGGGATTAHFYRTTDGGDSWQAMSTAGFPSGIRDTYWYSADEGLVCGWITPGGIIRTTNGGEDWETVSDVPVRFLVPLGGSSLLALPSQGSAVLVSDDRGQTWAEVPTLLPHAPECALAAGAGDFFVAGDATRIVLVDRDDVVAVGATDAPVSGAMLRPVRAVGARFALEVGGLAGAVEVSIHDVTGRRVETLPGTVPPGRSVTLAWTGLDHRGRALSPGVYFARLEGVSGVTARLVLAR